MKKKGFVFLLILLFSFGLVACKTVTTTTTTSGTTSGTTTTTTSGTTTGTTTTTTTTATTTTTTTTAAFTISLSGITDVGFTPEDKILTGEEFDLLAGVSAMGSDGVDYVDNILLDSDDAACQITDGKLMSNSAKVCIVTYTVVVNSKLARQDRNIKISAAPIVMEFTETELFDNDALFGTDYIITTTDPGVNSFHYWAENANVLGTTGSIKVLDGKLIIAQETMGGVNYALQTIALTEVDLVKGQYYKITLTITSTTDRVIDIVTKAPNNDYANDTHSLIEITAGTAEYEMIFVANQTKLHLNIMTGAVEGNLNAGTLEFSNFVLWDGPIVYDYVELPDFFTNADIAVDTAMEFISGTATDADFVRKFYYWDQAQGALLSGVTVEGGIEVTVVTQASDTWGAQLQWNDVNKAGTPLIVGAHYKLVMNINSPISRMINIAITGKTNALASSGSLDVNLNVGDNAVEFEFASLYDYFFMKIMFGNYGDLEQTGIFTITGLQLFEEEGATPVEPGDTGEVVGNVFGQPANVNGDIAINPEADPEGEFFVWKGIVDWFASWTAFPELTATYTNGEVALDIANEGAPEFWGIQLLYKGGDIVSGMDYMFAFVVESDVARKISVQIKDGGAYVDEEITLVVGINYVEINFTAEAAKFNLQINLGNFDSLADESGLLTFKNFMLSRPVVEMDGYFDNGDFETEMVTLNAADEDGWAYWSTQGIAEGWAEPNYEGTATISGGVLTAVTTTTTMGGAVWGCQIQYNHATADMTVGGVYKVEFDVHSDIDTLIVVELKYEDNSLNVDTPVNITAGDNHVVLYYVATQETFRLFIMLGLTDPSTLVFDNMKLSEPIIPVEEYDFTLGWVENDPSTYAFTETETGSTLVNYTKGVGQEWAFMKNTFTDDAAGYNTLTMVVKGTAGKSILIKPNDSGALEQTIVFTGEEQTVVIGAPEFTLIIIFAEPNTASVTGSFEIISAKLTYVEPDLIYGMGTPQNVNGDLVINPAADPMEEFFIWAGYDFGWNAYWTAFAEVSGTYTDGAVAVDIVNESAPEFWGIQLKYHGGLITVGENYVLSFNVNAEVARRINVEIHNATGQYVTLDYDLVVGDNPIEFTFEAAYEMFNLQFNIGNFSVDDESGLLVFSDFELIQEVIADYDFTAGWVENDPSTYAFTETLSGSTLVNYTKGVGQEWAFMKNTFTGDASGCNTMTLVVKGTAGKSILIKPNDSGALEQTIVFTGEEQTVVISAASFTLIIIFAEPNVASVTGSFEIISAVLSYVTPVEVIPWVGYGMDVVIDGLSVTATYADIPAEWWNVNLQSPVADFDGTKTGIIFTFTGVAGTEYKFKIEGGGLNVEGASVVATGASQEYVLDLSGKTEAERNGFNKIVVFVTTAAASGTFTVEGWEYVLPAWTGYGMSIVVTGLSVTATYADIPAEWWNVNLQSPVRNFDGTKTSIVFTFTGVAGTEYKFKIEGGGQNVEGASVVATGASQEYVLDISGKTEAQRDAFSLIVVFVTTPTASGTFTVAGWDYVAVP